MIDNLQTLSYDELRIVWKDFLETLDVAKSTKNTMCTDALYLWRHNSKEMFWSVVLDDSFEEMAKKYIADTLRKDSFGDIDSLVNSYYCQLKRFRNFVLGESVKKIHTTKSIKVVLTETEESVVPYPCVAEIEKYLDKWNELEDYHIQEKALNKLFLEICPSNTVIEDVLLKCATLNYFYSTNIFYIYPVAKHIVEQDIDDRLQCGDIGLVNDIQRVVIGDKVKNFYSFATKYCSHHKPEDYPIYDNYVEKVLCYFKKMHHFSTFKTADLKNYTIFKAVLEDFRIYYNLTDYSLKQIDQYLWQIGKEYFPKDYK